MKKELVYWNDLIVRIAQDAYLTIKKYVGTEFTSEKVGTRGAGGDMTLKIDKIAEDVIMEEFIKTKVPIKFVTEEDGFSILNENMIDKNEFNENEENKKDKMDRILDIISVDPIDGSNNISKGFPIACISIAHAFGRGKGKLSEIDCGVILNVFTGDIYHAAKGSGAYKNGKRINVNENKEIINSMFGISLSLGEPLPKFAKRYSFLFQQPLKIRSFGSNAFGFALVADGALDCFMDLQIKSRSFDIAAGYIILLEAGGFIWDLNFTILDAPLDVTTRLSFICSSLGLKDFFITKKDQFINAFNDQPHYNNHSINHT